MTEPANLSEQERADLVAYLDGELSGEAARQLETKLNLHAAARAEADALRRTWELLDFLPRPQPSSNFTHRTLERLSPVGSGEQLRRHRWRTRCLGLGWLALLLVSGWGGYAGYRWFAPRPSSERELLRHRQWIERLPRKVREELEKLPPAERAARMAKLQEEERQQQILWRRPLGGSGHFKPAAHLEELPEEVRKFVEKHLLPHLTPDERRRYEAAKGRWPEFPDTIKELSKRHPVLPPLHPPIARYEQLPQKAKIEAGPKTNWEKREDVRIKLQRVEGKWPEWALTFHALLSPEQRQRMPPLGASRPKDFSVEVRDFIEKSLARKVTFAEWRELHALEGKWPEYPLRLLRLAEKYKLEVPGMSLPASAEW
jgi:hypothetical protein